MLSGPMFERSGDKFRKIISSRDDGGAHYSIWEIKDGMNSIREIFPDGKADEMNFVLFSTSGVHGSYTLLEDLNFDESSDDYDPYITVLIVQPRLVCLRYGQFAISPEDIEWLKGLRQSSLAAVSKIGVPE